MLKMTYTESGLQLERLAQSVEDWIAQRTILALRTGTALVVEQGRASLILPLNAREVGALEHLAQQEPFGALELCCCDETSLEVSLRGTWIATCMDAHTGIFIAALSHQTEWSLLKLWESAQSCALSL